MVNRVKNQSVSCLFAAFVLLCTAAGLLNCVVRADALDRAHAHNDYEHARPLLDALDAGFGSVEADIYLIEGDLLVAHDRDKVKPERTLEALYLDPLRARIEKNKGVVHPHRPHFFLQIDIKSDGLETYKALHKTLETYADLLTRRINGRDISGAVTVVISGNRPRDFMQNQDVRYAGYDGRLSDLDKDIPAHFMPVVSDNWNNHFKWKGVGECPPEEKAKLQSIVERAHAAGYRIRFWAIPDHDGMWNAMWEAGVDFINTDRLQPLSRFLKGKTKGEN